VKIADSVAIVTGASSGIGEATARELAKRGAHVVVAARRLERIERLAVETGAVAIQTDVAQPDQLERLVAATVERFHRIDVLVNDAGIGSNASIQRDEPERIQQLFAVNVTAPVLLTRLALPHIPRGGVIVNVGSVAGEGPGVNLYAVTKSDMRSFSHGLRIQLAPLGIDVVLVEPGFIRTELTATRRVPIPMPGPEVVGRAIARAVERPRATVIVPRWYVPLVLGIRLTPRFLAEFVLNLRPPELRQPRGY
jgi:NAD(P)-dependent dehydrogenase (short-subunit alcohol dehydrogenase family)